MTDERDERRDRLAQALRDNLRRRKAQARASDSAGRTKNMPAGDDNRDI